jgi:hypothetical protein
MFCSESNKKLNGALFVKKENYISPGAAAWGSGYYIHQKTLVRIPQGKA